VAAVRRALQTRGYRMATSQGLLGQAVVACQTPECVEQALDAAGAAFAIVPAIWSRGSGGEELTLTLVQRSRRNLNASRMVGDELPAATSAMIDELLAQRAVSVAAPPDKTAATPPLQDEVPAHPHAWKAGPILLIAGGTAAALAIGVAAGARNDDQQLNTAAIAAWSAIGAAAVAGGIAWWVVGKRRRQPKDATASAFPSTITLHPTGIDLRLGF